MYVNAQENNEFKGLKGLKNVKISTELTFKQQKSDEFAKKNIPLHRIYTLY